MNAQSPDIVELYDEIVYPMPEGIWMWQDDGWRPWSYLSAAVEKTWRERDDLIEAGLDGLVPYDKELIAELATKAHLLESVRDTVKASYYRKVKGDV